MTAKGKSVTFLIGEFRELKAPSLSRTPLSLNWDKYAFLMISGTSSNASLAVGLSVGLFGQKRIYKPSKPCRIILW